MAGKRQAAAGRPGAAKRARRGTSAHDEAEEARLSALLFSGSAALLEDGLGAEAAHKGAAEDSGAASDYGSDSASEYDSDSDDGGHDEGEEEPELADELEEESEADDDAEEEGEEDDGPAAAWRDEEEESARVDVAGPARRRKLREHGGEEELSGAAYERRLRGLFAGQQAEQAWARLPDDGASEGSVSLLATTTAAVAAPTTLAAGALDVARLRDGNARAPATGAVHAVAFHSALPLLLTAGADKGLRLFQADGRENSLVQSVFLADLPVRSAFFAAGGAEVLAFGRRPYFYAYDLASGAMQRCAGVRGREERSLEHAVTSADGEQMAVLAKDGTALLLGGRSRQWVASLKMNGSLRAGAFSGCGRYLHTSGGDAEVYTWDLRTRRCLHRYADEACVASTSFAADAGGRYHACGSEAGVVNLYDATAAMASPAPEPRARIMNLTTAATRLAFCPDGQLLAMASFRRKDSLRLVHTASGTVFSNWPTQRTPLGYVTDFAFSSGGGMLAVANARGKVLLYRLNWYPSV